MKPVDREDLQIAVQKAMQSEKQSLPQQIEILLQKLTTAPQLFDFFHCLYEIRLLVLTNFAILLRAFWLFPCEA